MKIETLNLRLAFPNLFEPKINEQGKSQFGAAFIFPPAHDGIVRQYVPDGTDERGQPKSKKVVVPGNTRAALDIIIDQVGAAKWGVKWPALKKQMGAGDNLMIHNGDAKATLEGYEGNLYFNAYNAVRPLVVARDGSPLVAADGKPYSGCYVVAILDIWAQDNKFGKKINAQLQGVQFYKDGDAFAGGGKAAEATDFEPIADGADAEELV